jgi:UDP-N-acetylmuramyl pentapeptide phosphotransferase/UDP-N-acetylglucosamine-1-phosphate transferase
MRGDEVFAMVSFTVVAAAAGFLLFNFHPAKVFMGDSGSIPLGFLAGAFGVQGWWQHYWPFWFPILVFAPFMLDATATLLTRAWKHKNLGTAHREHYYQRLIQMNWGHRRVAILEYFLMLLSAVTALWMLEHDRLAQWAAIICWVAISAAMMAWLNVRWNKFNPDRGPK